MKRIFLVRHAHSDAGTFQTPDFERPLSSHGRRDAQKIARQMKELLPEPGILKISPAVRAKETAQSFLSVYPELAPRQILYEPQLYLPTVSVLWESVRDTSELYESLIIVSHNMALEDLIRFYRQDARMNPGSIAELFLEGTWESAAPSTSRLHNLFHP